MAQSELSRDDRFFNVAAVQVTESAANTFTQQEVDFGIGLGSRTGILIHAIDYYVEQPGGLGYAAAADAFRCAWLSNNNLTTLVGALNSPQCIDQYERVIMAVGALAQIEAVQPYTKNFSKPIIAVGNRGRFQFAAHSIGLAAAATYRSRLYFTYIDLKPEDYLELAESFNLLG